MDKKELRKDPVREKILSTLTYIEDNRAALYGIVATVAIIILAGSYFSTTAKELNKKSSLSFGKAINHSISGNEDESVIVFSELIESGAEATSGNSFAYLIDYYLTSGDFSKVDSMLLKNVIIGDDVLQSKIYILQGDINFNNNNYSASIDFYTKASKLYPTIKNAMALKKAITYYESGDKNQCRKIIEDLLIIDDLPFDVRNQCEKYLSIIDNGV